METEAKSLEQLALEAWLDADRDIDAAERMLRHRVALDRALYRQVIDPLLSGALRGLIARVVGLPDLVAEQQPEVAAAAAVACEAASAMQTAHVEPLPRRSNAPSAALLDGMRQIAVRNLLEFPLSTGMKLGDATGDDVTREAAACELLAAAKMREGRWLRLVADALPGPRVQVRDHLRHDQLQALLQCAVRAAVPSAVAETCAKFDALGEAAPNSLKRIVSADVEH